MQVSFMLTPLLTDQARWVSSSNDYKVELPSGVPGNPNPGVASKNLPYASFDGDRVWNTLNTTNLSGEGFKQPGLDGKSLHAPQSQYQSYHQLQAHNNEPQSQMQSQVQQLHPSSLPPLQPLNILFFNELNWWTTEDDLVAIASGHSITLPFASITFAEHKVNGKSKGIAHMVCDSPADAAKIKTWFDYNEFQGRVIKVELESSTSAGNGKDSRDGKPDFRTLPKDPQERQRELAQQRYSHSHYQQQSQHNYHPRQNFSYPHQQQQQYPHQYQNRNYNGPQQYQNQAQFPRNFNSNSDRFDRQFNNSDNLSNLEARVSSSHSADLGAKSNLNNRPHVPLYTGESHGIQQHYQAFPPGLKSLPYVSTGESIRM